jgi:hypothetical protein
MTDTRPPVAPVEGDYPSAFYVLFAEGHALSDGNANLAIRKWSTEPFLGALKYVFGNRFPQMSQEGHELAAKIWNERYVEAVKTSAKNSEIYREQIDVIADEVHSLRASLQNIRNIALERLADGKQDATVKKIELISRRALLGDDV